MLYPVALPGRQQWSPLPPRTSKFPSVTAHRLASAHSRQCWRDRLITENTSQIADHVSLATHSYTFIKPLFESRTSFQSVSLLLQKHEDNCKTKKQQCYRYLLIPSLTFTQTILQYHRKMRKKTCTQSVCINGSLFEARLVSSFQCKTWTSTPGTGILYSVNKARINLPIRHTWEGRCYQVQIRNLQTLLIQAYLELRCWKWLTELRLTLFQEFTHHNLHQLWIPRNRGCDHSRVQAHRNDWSSQRAHTISKCTWNVKVVWKENIKSLLAPWPQPSKALPSVLSTCLSMLLMGRQRTL